MRVSIGAWQIKSRRIVAHFQLLRGCRNRTEREYDYDKQDEESFHGLQLLLTGRKPLHGAYGVTDISNSLPENVLPG